MIATVAVTVAVRVTAAATVTAIVTATVTAAVTAAVAVAGRTRAKVVETRIVRVKVTTAGRGREA